MDWKGVTLMAIAGIDVGTAAAKLTVYDENGTLLFSGFRDYPTSRGMGKSELDAHLVRDAVFALLREAAQTVAIEAVGVSAFGESFVLLDEKDEPVLPVMLYTDPRGGVEAESLAARVPGIDGICGAKPHSMYSLPKLMWIKNNDPAAYKRARRVCLMEDYVTYLLTGERAIDWSEAARTMALDVERRAWSDEILGAAGIDKSLFSRVVRTGEVVGTIRPARASALGLSKSMRVVAGCHDQVAAAVGSGVLAPGAATDGAGTTQCMTPVFEKWDRDGRLQRDNYVVVPFLQPGRYVTYAFQFTGGAVAKWYVENMAGYTSGQAGYEALEARMSDAPTGMLLLPHFAGAATPYMDAGSQGAILGLTLEKTQADVYRAVLEGVCYEMALNRERLAACGIRIASLNATGGGARSRRWLQMKADVLNVPIQRMKNDDAGTIGGIMLTGVACGAFPGLAEAAKTFVGVRETYEPRADFHERYLEIYERYRKVYDAVRPLMGGNES